MIDNGQMLSATSTDTTARQRPPADALPLEALLLATTARDAQEPKEPTSKADLLRLLTRIQLKGELPHIYQDSLLLLLQQEYQADQKLHPRDRSLIGFLDAAFRQLLKDAALDPVITALIHRLHIPLTRLALLDASFLDRPEHKGRQLIDILCQHGIGWHPGLGKAGQRFIDTVCDILLRLDREFDDDPVSIDAIHDSLHEALEREQAQFRKLVERTIATETGLLKIRQAEQDAIELVNRLTAGKALPVTATRLLQRDWCHMLRQVALHQGSDSELWARLKKLTTHIVWTLLPSTDAAEQQKKFAIMAKLPEFIQAELSGLSLPGTDVAGMVQTLEGIHLRLLRQESQETLAVTPLSSTALETGVDVEISQNLIRHAQSIEVGQWLMMTPEDQPAQRMLLVQKNETANHYLFVNRAGIKVADMRVDQLAYQLVNGRLKALPQQDAFSLVCQRLRQDLLLQYQEYQEQDEREREAQRLRQEEHARLRAQAIEKARQEAEARERQEADARERAAEEARRAEERRQAETLARERAELEALEKAHRQAVDTMALGTWVQFFNDDGSVTECHLALKMRSTNKFVFVNRAGIKVAEKKGEELLALLKDGKFAIVSGDATSDSAIQRLIGSLKR